jgi:4-amino-4-deoxy-L-arabinose transferase-like glycosyltransferase
MRKLSKENWILLAILIVGFLIRLEFVLISNVPWWDESVYLNLGSDLSKNPLHYSLENSGWSDFIPLTEDTDYNSPKIGFRPPLLPYLLAFFYFLKLDFLIKFLLPLIGTLTIFLVYLLGKEMFDKKVGIISAAIFSLIPIHVIYSAKILNDVLVTFFIVLAFLFFWKGFEKGKEKYKIFFGITLGIGLLTRYTMLWVILIFPAYLLIRDKSLKFLKDKHLWYAILGFFAVLIPWFIYGYFEYGNIFGGFIHGFKAAAYWGGRQSWMFFFQNSWYLFSISGVLFILSLVWIFFKKEYKKKEIYILLIWSIFYFAMLIIMPHKEGRFVIPIVPAISLIIGYSLDKIKKYKKIIFVAILLILFLSCIWMFINDMKISSNVNTKCFIETMDFLKSQNGEYKTISENPAIVRYFTNTESSFYPEINENSFSEVSNSTNKKVYFVFNRLNSGFETEKWTNLKEILSENYKLEFECPEDSEVNFVYSDELSKD